MRSSRCLLCASAGRSGRRAGPSLHALRWPDVARRLSDRRQHRDDSPQRAGTTDARSRCSTSTPRWSRRRRRSEIRASRLTRDVAVEVGGALRARRRLAVDITQDAESELVTLADEQVSQYVIDGGVLWQIRGSSSAGALKPFAAAASAISGSSSPTAPRSKRARSCTSAAACAISCAAAAGTGVPSARGSKLKTQVRTGGVDIDGKPRVLSRSSTSSGFWRSKQLLIGAMIELHGFPGLLQHQNAPHRRPDRRFRFTACRRSRRPAFPTCTGCRFR